MPVRPPPVLTAYIAARTDRADELARRAEQLAELGVQVIGSWLHSRPGLDPVADPNGAAAAAAQDMAELRQADVFIAVNEGVEAAKFGRGGRHVEFGAALALQKRMLVIGPVEHVFHVAKGVTTCADFDEAVEVIAGWIRTAPNAG